MIKSHTDIQELPYIKEKVMSDVSAIQRLLSDVSGLVVDGIGAAKVGKLSALPKLFALLGDIEKIVKDCPIALPEMQHLSPDDFPVLASAAYSAVQKIVAAIKAA